MRKTRLKALKDEFKRTHRRPPEGTNRERPSEVRQLKKKYLRDRRSGMQVGG